MSNYLLAALCYLDHLIVPSSVAKLKIHVGLIQDKKSQRMQQQRRPVSFKCKSWEKKKKKNCKKAFEKITESTSCLMMDVTTWQWIIAKKQRSVGKKQPEATFRWIILPLGIVQ